MASRGGFSPGLSAGLSVAGFILPGNKVDVLLNLRGNANDETGGGSTTTLLQSIEILAVDQRLDAPADNKVNPRTSVRLRCWSRPIRRPSWTSARISAS